MRMYILIIILILISLIGCQEEEMLPDFINDCYIEGKFECEGNSLYICERDDNKLVLNLVKECVISCENNGCIGEDNDNQGCGLGFASLEGKVTDNITGEALSGVEVTVDGCSVLTESDGSYKLLNIAENPRTVVTFIYDGYYKNSTIITIEQFLKETIEFSSNYLEYSLNKYDSEERYEAINSKNWSSDLSEETVVSIPENIYIDSNGNPYLGFVNASFEYNNILTDEARNTFLGEFKTKDDILFESYGLIVVKFRDDDGNNLKINSDITLTFPAMENALSETIALWYYNYETGYWVEDGYATRQENGSYISTVSHAGAWSLNKALEEPPGIYFGRIIFEDGVPGKDIRVFAVGTNWIFTDLSTNEDGWFELEVIPNKTFRLGAYNYKDKYGAVFDGELPALASGEIEGDRN